MNALLDVGDASFRLTHLRFLLGYRLTYEYLCAESARLVLPPGVSEGGRSSLLLAERSSFSLISCSTLISYYLFLLQIYIDFFRGSLF